MTSIAAERAWAARVPAALLALLSRHRWALTIGIPFGLASYLLPVPALPYVGPGLEDLLVVASVPIWCTGAIALAQRRPPPWGKWASVLIATVACRWFLTAFLRWKSFMPQWAPFRWDEPLVALESWLHGGQPLAIRLLPLVHSPTVLHGLLWLYDHAMPVMVVVILWQAWADDRRRARQFALAFVLTWILLGIVVAGAFSSVGPIMLERLTGDTQFRPLLAALQADGAQDLLNAASSLWAWWTVAGASVISAFPSVHVAMPALYACVARGWVRWVFVAYTVTTFLGSVMLGWHYAIDGYAAVLGVVLIWRMAGRLTAGT